MIEKQLKIIKKMKGKKKIGKKKIGKKKIGKELPGIKNPVSSGYL
ncbi:hypothetical protein [Methanosarcina barkeri]|nr:hypothetical protein [Methanosarcina barkeri]